MQAAGQYGEVPQYAASRVGASHGHMFNLSHEMSLSSSASTAAAQTHAHGHGLSLSHSPAHSQASQSQSHSQFVSSTQPLFLQSQHSQQQQHAHNGFSVSMGSATPTAATAAPSTSQAPQPAAQALQSAAQQLQADIKQHQHQQQQYLQSQQIPAHDLGAKEALNTQQQSLNTGDLFQQTKPKEPSTEPRENAAIAIASTRDQMAVTMLNRPTKEEASGDGDEVDEEGERGSGGNRWPREEALALLKIRSEMDAVFRDSSLKGPLWEEISRKLAEMGYQRSAKKCKEKFENVHKYYKRTKEGKTGRQDGKSYRFFAQLEALYGKAGGYQHQHHHHQNQHRHMNTCSTLINTSKNLNPHGVTNLNAVGSNNIHSHSHSGGLFSSPPGDNPVSAVGFNVAAPSHSLVSNMTTSSNVSAPLPLASFPPYSPTPTAAAAAAAATNAHIARTLERVELMNREPGNHASLQYCFNSSDESHDDSDNEDEDDDHGDDDDDDDDDGQPATRESAVPAAQHTPRGKKRKRKSLESYLVLFEKVMKKVLDKQEHMQQKFLEALERRDQDRMIREEAWKRQEMARLNREHDVRAAERALSASRDASLVAFLQKLTGQTVALPHQSSCTPLQMSNHHSTSTAIVPADFFQNDSNGDRDPYDPSSSKRWPKAEVLVLIRLRTSLDQRFHEPGSKAVLWEEISAAMASQGYVRTAKRCKEKWENINKYFKKAKESNKKRPENAKTCPYFHHLNALYKEGLLGMGGAGGASSISSRPLMVSDKVEEQSEDVIEQGVNSSKNSGEESGQPHDSASAVLSSQNEIGTSGLPETTRLPTTIAGTVMASPPACDESLKSASLPLLTCSSSSDTKMHIFMGSDREEDKDLAGITKASNDVVQQHAMIDLSAAAPRPQPAANSLPFNLDHAMSTSRSLSSAPSPVIKQSQQAHT